MQEQQVAHYFELPAGNMMESNQQHIIKRKHTSDTYFKRRQLNIKKRIGYRETQ